jgi:hypothetical protein
MTEISTDYVKDLMRDAILERAAHKVCNPGLYDMNSREFMLESFKGASPPEDLDPTRTTEDIIHDAMMRHSDLYKQVMEYLATEKPDEQ